MAQFTDKNGTVWQIVIDVTTAKRCIKSLGFDPLTLADGGEIKRLNSPVFLVDLLYVICLPQIDDRKMTDEQFAANLVGDPINDATAALLEGVAEFFPKDKAALIRRMNQSLSQLMAIQISLAGKRLENIPALLNQLGDWSMSTPASSASTPDLSASTS